MKRLLMISLIIIMLSAPVMANNFYHEMSIVVEGEYTLTTNVTLPDVTQTIDVEGIGKVMIDTKLKKFESASWWDLF